MTNKDFQVLINSLLEKLDSLEEKINLIAQENHELKDALKKIYEHNVKIFIEEREKSRTEIQT